MAEEPPTIRRLSGAEHNALPGANQDILDSQSVGTQATVASSSPSIGIDDPQRSRNVERSNMRFRGTEVSLRMGRQEQAPDPDIIEFCNRHIQHMKDSHNRKNWVHAFMVCYKNKSATVWERICTPFFYTCEVSKLDPFHWIQPSMNVEAVFIQQDDLEANNFHVHNVKKVPEHLDLFITEAYITFRSDWADFIKSGGDLLYRGERVIRIPSCPNFKEWRSLVLEPRTFFFIVWKCTEDAGAIDKRDAVLKFFVDNLTETKSMKVFRQRVEAYAVEGLKAIMVGKGLQNTARYRELCGANPTVRAPAANRGRPRTRPSSNNHRDNPAPSHTNPAPSHTNQAQQPQPQTEDEAPIEASEAPASIPTKVAPNDASEDPTSLPTDGTISHESPIPPPRKRKRLTRVLTAAFRAVKEWTFTPPFMYAHDANRLSHNHFFDCFEELEDMDDDDQPPATICMPTVVEPINKPVGTKKPCSTATAVAVAHALVTPDRPLRRERHVRKELAIIKLVQDMEGFVAQEGDAGMQVLLQYWSKQCEATGRNLHYYYALKGVTRALNKSPARNIYADHHRVKQEEVHLFAQPKPVKTAKGMKYENPGELFVTVASDMFHVMRIFLVSLARYKGMAPPRWHWETLLLEALSKNGAVTHEKRCLAFLVCLSLAAVTPDLSCIAGTVALDCAGLLTVDALAGTTWGTIFPIVQKSGLGEITAKHIVEMGKQLRSLGRMPQTQGELLNLPGIGPKAANVYLLELLGLRLGIATDRHVEFVCLALGIHVHPTSMTGKVRYVEESLRTWVNVGDYKMWNPVLGGMAQVFGQIYRTFNTPDKKSAAKRIVLAMLDHLHELYDVELIWFVVGRIRTYYLVERKRSKPAQVLYDLLKEEEARAREQMGLPPCEEDGCEEDGDRKMPARASPARASPAPTAAIVDPHPSEVPEAAAVAAAVARGRSI